MAPTHGHMLFVGWFLQFALGITLWLLPRKRTTERALGYRERSVLLGFVGLNAGLLLRVLAEPLQRSGHDTTLVNLVLVASAILQISAVSLWAIELWPRLAPRAARQTAP